MAILNKKKLLEIITSKKVAPLLALLILAGTFASAMAYYNEEQALGNPLKTSHSGAAIVEEFNPDSSFLPGETVIKKVAFKNTGKMEVFLRVEVPPEEGWYYAAEVKDKNGNIIHKAGDLANTAELDPKKVIKLWNGIKDSDKKVWVNGETSEKLDGLSEAIDYNVETDYWTKIYKVEEASGTKYYRYYKRILAPGEATDDILNEIQLATDISNDRHETDYSNKVYHLTFNAEAVPVEEHDGKIGVPAIWNMIAVDKEITDEYGKIISWEEAELIE